MSADSTEDTGDTSLSPQLHTFVIVVACFMMFVWFLRVLVKAHSLYDLYKGLSKRTVVRLDGARHLNHLSRGHMQQLLRARAEDAASTVDRLQLSAAIDRATARITAHPDGGHYVLTFNLSCDVYARVDVYVGVLFSSISNLHADSSTIKKARANEKKQRQERERIKIDIGGPKETSSLLFGEDDYLFRSVPQILSPGLNQEVSIRLETEWLHKNSQLRINPCYPLIIHVSSATELNDEKYITSDMVLPHSQLTLASSNTASNTQDDECLERLLLRSSFDLQLIRTPSKVFELQDIYGMTEADDIDCSVCFCAPKTIILLPCRHLAMCDQCRITYSESQQHGNRCPLCNEEFHSFLKFTKSSDLPGNTKKSKSRRRRRA